MFAGWATAPDATEAVSGDITMPGGDYALYALWKHADVTVTFDAEGGTHVAAQTVAWEGTATAPAAPTREGYEFGGWYYFGAGSSTPARFAFEEPLENDVTLYAAWKSTRQPTTYTIIHKTADGIVLAQETHDGAVGETVTASPLDANDPARAGCRYVSSAGTTIDLAEDAAANTVTFVYSKDPSYVYLVRCIDAATGEQIGDLIAIPSGDVVVDVTAPQVAGYIVRGQGVGYVGADGTREVVFVYDKVKAPTPTAGTPAAPSAKPAASTMAAAKTMPTTGDAAGTAGAVAALAAAGSALTAFGARRRKGAHARK